MSTTLDSTSTTLPRRHRLTDQQEHWLVVALRRAQDRLSRLGDTTGSAEIDAALAGTPHSPNIIIPAPATTGITRRPGACLSCRRAPGTGHASDCYFAPFLPGRAP